MQHSKLYPQLQAEIWKKQVLKVNKWVGFVFVSCVVGYWLYEIIRVII